MNKKLVLWWLCVSVLLALGTAPLLSIGDQAAREQEAQHREAIRQMSQSERERLNRNFQAYQRLSEAQIRAYQEFHDKLEQDRTQHDGELAEALQHYHEWLSTIEPYQRDQLRRTSDPQERIQLVKQILKDQGKRDATRFLADRFSNEGNEEAREYMRFLRYTPVLNEEDLTELMKGIRQIEAGKLSLTGREAIEQRSGLERYVLLLKTIRENSNPPPSAYEHRHPFVIPEFEHAFTTAAEQISRFVFDEQAREYVSDPEGKLRWMPPALRVQTILLKSLLIRALEEEKRSEHPSRQERMVYFNNLPESEQDYLLALSSLQFWEELGHMVSKDIDITDSEDVLEAFFSPERRRAMNERRRERFVGRGPGSGENGERPWPPRRGDGPRRGGFDGEQSGNPDPRDGRPNSPPPRFNNGPPPRDEDNRDRPRPADDRENRFRS